MAENKKLDPYSDTYKKTKLEDLVEDALARDDAKAVDWLEAESAKKDERTRNGVNVKVARNIAKIRAEYARKFLNYKPKKSASAEKARKRKQEKAEQDRLDLFKRAHERLGK